MYTDLLLAVLTPIVAFGLKWFFTLIKYEVDAERFNALVAAIVTWLVVSFLGGVAHQANPSLF